MTPASTAKLVPAAAALLELGADFRFSTRLVADGPVEDGVVRGNVLVISNGDPSLRADLGVPAAVAFETWAKELSRQGIRRVAGRLVGYSAPSRLVDYGQGWALDDLPFAYAQPVSRLQADANLAVLTVFSAMDADGHPSWQVSPPEAAALLDCQLQTGTPFHFELDWHPGSTRINCTATIPPGFAPTTRSVALFEPTMLYLALLHRVLAEHGIAVEAQPVIRNVSPPADLAPPLYVHYSPPLSEILTHMLKTSDNLVAETVMRTLGENSEGEFSFAAGRRAAAAILRPLGFDLDQARCADGSGLSRYNHCSPDQLAGLLTAMARQNSERALVWKGLLPTPAEGTLARRIDSPTLEKCLKAKTGSMSSIRAMAGYLTAASGQECAFAILLNAHLAPGAEVDHAIQQLLLWLQENL